MAGESIASRHDHWRRKKEERLQDIYERGRGGDERRRKGSGWLGAVSIEKQAATEKEEELFPKVYYFFKNFPL